MPASKFDKPHRDALYDNLAKGMPLPAACAGAGIGQTTLKDWRAKAKAAGRKRGKLTAAERAYVQFEGELDDAIARGHHWLYTKWLEEAEKERGKGNWLPYEKMLERRFRDDYRIQQRVEHSGPDGKPLMRIDIEALSDEELDTLKALLEKGKPADAAARRPPDSR